VARTRGAGVNLLVLALVTVAVVLLDQYTKEIALRLLEPGRFVPFLGPAVGWQLIFNPGAAFGLQLPAVVFPVVTLVVLITILRSLPPLPAPLLVSVQGLVLGGALGNVVDRLVRPGSSGRFGGHVVDFVAWGSFPRFNLADAAITVGVILFLLLALRDEYADGRSS
jgi:signal peptidase II